MPLRAGRLGLVEGSRSPSAKGIRRVQLCHRPRGVSARFDDPNLVSSAGLVPVLGLAESARLRDLADEHLGVPTDKGANAGLKVSLRRPPRVPDGRAARRLCRAVRTTVGYPGAAPSCATPGSGHTASTINTLPVCAQFSWAPPAGIEPVARGRSRPTMRTAVRRSNGSRRRASADPNERLCGVGESGQLVRSARGG
jgi:hypothetical protein